MTLEQPSVVMESTFREDLLFWVEKERRTALRILRLIEAVMRDPFQGEGKPEPLKGMPGTWSRRIDKEHRMLYFVTKNAIHFLQARHHYDD